MDLYVVERRLREAEKALEDELRVGETNSSPVVSLRCERLHRVVAALQKRRDNLLEDVKSYRPHCVPAPERPEMPDSKKERKYFERYSPLPSKIFSRRREKWLHAGREDDEELWEWEGRTIRVLKNAMYSDGELIHSLLEKAKTLEDQIAALQGEHVLTIRDKWDEETKLKVERGEKLGEESVRAREAAREQLRKRAELIRREFEHNSAVSVQSTFRGFLGRRKMREARAKYNQKIRHEGAEIIQSRFRGYMARKQVRERKARMDLDVQNAAATVIQSQFRGSVARKKFKVAGSEDEKREAASCMIQAWWRGCKGRRDTLTLRKDYYEQLEEVAAVMLQTAWRCYKARQEKTRLEHFKMVEMEEAAAIMFQSAWRGYKARKEMRKLKREMKDVDSELKSMDYADKVKQTLYAKLFLNKEERAAILIQAIARCYLERKRLAKERQTKQAEAEEDAKIDRMLEKERGKHILDDIAAENKHVSPKEEPKTIFDDYVELPLEWANGRQLQARVYVIVHQIKVPYQLRIEATEMQTMTRFFKRIDVAVLESLLLPMFTQDENDPEFADLMNSEDSRPVVRWVMEGVPPRRKHLVSWIINRMWIDQQDHDGPLDLCLGSVAVRNDLNKSLTSAMHPSSPIKGKKTLNRSTRNSFKVRYAEDL